MVDSTRSPYANMLAGLPEMARQLNAASGYSEPLSRPAPVQGEGVTLYESPSDVIGDRIDGEQKVQAFQGALSIRVIDIKTFRPVWIGLATSQNLSYAEAMWDSAGALADKIVK